MIAWTGEITPKIRRSWERKPAESGKKTVTGVANGQIDDIQSIKNVNVKNEEAVKELVSLTKADKDRFTEQLNKGYRAPGGKKYEMVPIWTLEDADGNLKAAAGETPETQSRFRKYAEQGMNSTDQADYSSLAITALRPLDRDRWQTGD